VVVGGRGDERAVSVALVSASTNECSPRSLNSSL